MPKLVDVTTPTSTTILTDSSAPLSAPINQPITSSPRKGEHYNHFISSGIAHKLSHAIITQEEAATQLSLTQRTISSYLSAYIQDKRSSLKSSSWRLNSRTAQLLKTDNFPAFRAKYFRTKNNQPYLTKPFHMRWIKSILHAIEYGGKLTILSPPRHGKTELLIHFVVWLIIKDPNIRILWIGGTEDIAEDAVGLVNDELTSNELLIHDFLPPNFSFKPTGKSSMWNRGKFKVSTRTVAQKSATLRAMGRGKRILSLDADLIITDDIDDAESVLSPTSRENTRTWWDQNLTTRKEDNTAWVNIGSRQHPDDIHNKTLEDDTWEAIVEQAYNVEAELELHEMPSQVPTDHNDRGNKCTICSAWDKSSNTLFPELRPMYYLMSTMKSIGRRKFNMIYLNRVDDTGVVIFPKKHYLACRNMKRSILRLDQIPEVSHPREQNYKLSYTHLIGGLDPSGFSGYQAAYIWAFNIPCQLQYMIDLEAEKGGGIQQARATIKHYFEILKLRHWIIEENLYQGGIIKDEKLKDYCSANGILLEGHLTYTNKWDPEIGVTSMAPLLENRQLDFPYADDPSQSKTDEYFKQLKNFEGKLTKTQKKRTAKSDLVMASWFPQIVYRRLVLEYEAELEEIESDYDQTLYPDMMMGDVFA